MFDGVECSSLEGVLQSFKCPDINTQRKMCSLIGRTAKHTGEKYNNWMEKQTLFWNGAEYSRKSAEYQYLLDRLYDAVYEQDEGFRTDLKNIGDKPFDHRKGNCNKEKTVLTRSEFIGELRRLIRKHNGN